MELVYHGHAVVSVTMDDDVKILIDPFINGNNLCDLNVDTIKTNYIIVTHAHADHLGDTIEIAKNNQALVITTVEIAEYLNHYGINTHGMQPGGAFEFAFGKVKLTPAIHGSSVTIDNKPFTLGLATGVIIQTKEQTMYHAGDTALFYDLKLIGRQNDIDIAFLPIGDNFTMGPEDASLAAEWLQAKHVVPIHYDTFPIIKQDPLLFIEMLPKKVGIVPEIGQLIKY